MCSLVFHNIEKFLISLLLKGGSTLLSVTTSRGILLLSSDRCLISRQEFNIQRTVHRDIFLKWKPTRCTISQICLIKYSTCFGNIHCPSSGVSQHCIHATGICHASSVGCWMFDPDHASRQPTELAWQIPIACVQCWDTPHDGQWTFPKHVGYFIK